MFALNNTRIAIRACQMHYLENLSQKEIADKLNISRPQISRILSAARKENLVTISINDPFAEETALQEQLRRRYPLQEAMAFNTSASGDGLAEFGRMAAQYLGLFIADQSTVGIMSGRTIAAAIAGVGSFQRRGLHVIPLVGGLGTVGASWHANSIAMQLAQKSGGISYALNAPIVVQEEKTKDAFVSDPAIASVLQSGRECNVAITGVGDICEDSTTVAAGGLSSHDMKELQAAGVVASICCSYLDAAGNVLDLPLSRRTIGLTLPDLADSKIVALAIGKQKVRAIHSVLSSGHIHALMTDMETAQALLEL